MVSGGSTAFDSAVARGDGEDAVVFLRAIVARKDGRNDLPIWLSSDDATYVLSGEDAGESVFRLAACVWAEDGMELAALQMFDWAVAAGAKGARAAAGEAHAWFGEYQKAACLLESSVDEPDTRTPWLEGVFGESLAQIGQTARAIPHLRLGYEEHVEFGVPLGKLLKACGEFDEALEVLSASTDAGVFGAALLLGNLLIDDFHDVAGARRAYETGIETSDAHSAYNLGVLLLTVGDGRGAEAAFETARGLGDCTAPPDL